MSFTKAKDMKKFQREGAVAEEKMYVAVSKEIEENRSILTWALQNSGGKKVCLIHVEQSTKNIQSPKKEVTSSGEMGRGGVSRVLDAHLRIIHKSGVLTEKLYIEAASIEKGIIQLVQKHNIGKLVIGAAADKHYSRKMTVRSEKALYVKDNAPPFCHIWFVCSGNLIHTREAASSPWNKDLVPPCWSTARGESTFINGVALATPIPKKNS